MASFNTTDARPQLLIVDDEPEICFTLQYVLHDYGYSSRATTNGATALALLQQQQFDLLLLDPRLPGGIDGQNIIQLAAVHRPRMVIVLLTGALDLAIPYDRVDLRRFDALDKTALPAAIVTGVAHALAQRPTHLNELHLAR